MDYANMEWSGFLDYLWDITHKYHEEDIELPWFSNEKDIRKACELPVKKELVHYASRYGEKKNVTKYRPAIYGTFDVVLEDGTQHRIHRDYFRSMQKPSFLKDMQDEDKNI